MGSHVRCSVEMGHVELRRHVRVDRRVARLRKQALDRLGLSVRAYHRILKVARTIADLEGAEKVRELHAAEAIQYRGMDRVGA
jgi:magnesium chelatase family protein